MTEPFPTADALPDEFLEHGTHPFWDRDDVHEVYAGWRHVFEEYDPSDRISAAEQIQRAREQLANERQTGRQLGLDL